MTYDFFNDDRSSLHDVVEFERRDIWEEYEEWFASDPYSYAITEIGRALHHALSLDGSMSDKERDILLAIAYTAQRLDPALGNSDHFTKHTDGLDDIDFRIVVKAIKEAMPKDIP